MNLEVEINNRSCLDNKTAKRFTKEWIKEEKLLMQFVNHTPEKYLDVKMHQTAISLISFFLISTEKEQRLELLEFFLSGVRERVLELIELNGR